MDTSLYSMGADSSDQHPHLVEEVIAQAEAIEAAGLRLYGEKHDMTLEACFETLLYGPGRPPSQRRRSLNGRFLQASLGQPGITVAWAPR